MSDSNNKQKIVQQQDNRRKIKRPDIKTIIRSVWIIIVVCLYPCAFMYFKNFTESTADKIVFPFALFITVAVLALCINIAIYRNIDKAAIFTSLFMVLFINYNIILKLTAQYTVLTQNITNIIVVSFLLVLGTILFITKKELDSVSFIIGFVFSGLIVMNIIMAIPDFIDSKKANEEIEVEQYARSTDFRENIYYIIMDEYGGRENLEHYYNFDNSEFLGYLSERGFSVSNTSHNYEGINTYDILPNLLNIDYVVNASNTVVSQYEKTTNPVLYRFFKEAGYNIKMINHIKGLNSEGYDVIYESATFGTFANGLHDIDYYLLENSFVNYWVQNTNRSNSGDGENLAKEDIYKDYRNEIIKILDLLEEQPSKKSDKPTFMICYLCFPHVPYVLTADGQPAEPKAAYDCTDKQAYIGQLQYLNHRLEGIVDSIIENDPNAIVVLQGDHGARNGYHLMYQYKKSEYNEKLESEMMENQLNCVYWGSAEKKDIEGLSGLNTWRVILNNLYGTNYEMVEVPERFIYNWRYESGQR